MVMDALDVYNALNDSDYDDPSLVEMKTLDKCISLTVRNDSACGVETSVVTMIRNKMN